MGACVWWVDVVLELEPTLRVFVCLCAACVRFTEELRRELPPGVCCGGLAAAVRRLLTIDVTKRATLDECVADLEVLSWFCPECHHGQAWLGPQAEDDDDDSNGDKAQPVGTVPPLAAIARRLAELQARAVASLPVQPAVMACVSVEDALVAEFVSSPRATAAAIHKRLTTLLS